MRSSIFEYMRTYGHENVLLCQDNATGLNAVIVIHDTTLGPATGGARMWPYTGELDAIEDGLRLARGMTYKYAAAGVNLGGGKCVILGDPKKDKSEALFRVLGRFINRLNGTYLIGEDVGTDLHDMEYLRMETPYVLTLPASLGGVGPIGGATALGVFEGMRAALNEAYGDERMEGRSVAVQGLGSVGSEIVPLLLAAGARVIVADTDQEKVEAIQKRFDVQEENPSRIHACEVDIYCPCALGAVINDQTLPELRCRIVCGSANNQLQEEHHGEEISKRNILYAPDYIVNAGGTIFDSDRLHPGGFNRERAQQSVHRIYETTAQVFRRAQQESISTSRAADQIAEKRLAHVKAAKGLATHGDLLREKE